MRGGGGAGSFSCPPNLGDELSWEFYNSSELVSRSSLITQLKQTELV